MRISDWSSDVCSSDLLRSEAAAAASWSASGADRLATEVPKRRRDSTSSSGSAGMLAKVISGRRPVPVTRMVADRPCTLASAAMRSEEHTSELQSLMRISYAVFCLKKKKNKNIHNYIYIIRTTQS